ncbi:putative 2-oxoglutarate dehydrogenase,E2 component, dihydrolipoamide succinyltransferase [Leishmania major strain Friedlin]|uniref:Dihydrolipoamide acetyltransferase component of pyruvate dehydrogenase complex n=1 Tax=Leishmania major TaxID=5664 RepID=Q4Q822_LEIMA|nr:putative 2-oxoglutarate dehydrogenase,E2 component, dihydrolipoamide succinyltransferase [Leishmania major strain Friedlin]CAG9577356.1 2-oxoglutarate_dehydrogenase_-_E2_component_-_dihydrolipoamide_succinyltransferase_-_putative [Leishmania major strain Friedlin]CAJ05698.1 putative 2-oxoglutarate dehydrogenase,E2 component, dihydrolipoamide succinyltransferase [Leishmania major strain Friedlin]|eukprot:XP_001684526.1 putative 2-oxoglutarate dehydrogenase,E2 component, dihydrolipoamide succinyltransferase [Leishmania major strain Friedlin]
MFRRVSTRVLPTACSAAHNLNLRFCLSINVPTIAESISTGKVVNWTKKVGDAVAEDEVICQIESDKLNVDVRAPANGVITKINFEEGADVEVGAQLSTMKEGPAPAAAAPKAAEVKLDAPKAEPPKAAAPAASAPAAPAAPAAAAKPAMHTIAGADPRTKSVRISSMRRRIADRLKASQNTCAMLTTFNEIDMTPLFQLRDKYKDEFHKRHDVKLGLMSPFVKASAIALKDVPIVNASFGKDTIDYHEFVDIAIAVATPRGLVVPVIRDVQNMNLANIETAIADYAARARINKLTMAEMTGGTFTISNGGVFGSWMGTPIINPPHSAILGMHAIKKKPWVVGNEIKIRDIMAVALTYDHRLIDGSDAVTFLVKVKNLIEDPARMVLDLS